MDETTADVPLRVALDRISEGSPGDLVALTDWIIKAEQTWWAREAFDRRADANVRDNPSVMYHRPEFEVEETIRRDQQALELPWLRFIEATGKNCSGQLEEARALAKPVVTARSIALTERLHSGAWRLFYRLKGRFGAHEVNLADVRTVKIIELLAIEPVPAEVIGEVDVIHEQVRNFFALDRGLYGPGSDLAGTFLPILIRGLSFQSWDAGIGALSVQMGGQKPEPAPPVEMTDQQRELVTALNFPPNPMPRRSGRPPKPEKEFAREIAQKYFEENGTPVLGDSAQEKLVKKIFSEINKRPGSEVSMESCKSWVREFG